MIGRRRGHGVFMLERSLNYQTVKDAALSIWFGVFSASLSRVLLLVALRLFMCDIWRGLTKTNRRRGVLRKIECPLDYFACSFACIYSI